MKIVKRTAAVLITAAAAMAISAGPAAALPVLGDPDELVRTALTTKEGCAYPGILVPVIAQVSPDAVEGCGYFERDPAFGS